MILGVFGNPKSWLFWEMIGVTGALAASLIYLICLYREADQTRTRAFSLISALFLSLRFCAWSEYGDELASRAQLLYADASFHRFVLERRFTFAFLWNANLKMLQRRLRQKYLLRPQLALPVLAMRHIRGTFFRIRKRWKGLAKFFPAV